MLDKVEHDVSGDHQSGHAGDPADRGRDAPAAGRGSLQALGGQGLLRGEEDRVMVHAPIAQLPAHDPGQGTAGGLADVGDGEFAGVQLVAGAQGGDGGYLYEFVKGLFAILRDFLSIF